MNCAMHAQNVKKNIETFLLGTLRAVSVIDKSFPKCTPIVDLVLFQLLFFSEMANHKIFDGNTYMERICTCNAWLSSDLIKRITTVLV